MLVDLLVVLAALIALLRLVLLAVCSVMFTAAVANVVKSVVEVALTFSVVAFLAHPTENVAPPPPYSDYFGFGASRWGVIKRRRKRLRLATGNGGRGGEVLRAVLGDRCDCRYRTGAYAAQRRRILRVRQEVVAAKQQSYEPCG
jgi:hypothetical protein